MLTPSFDIDQNEEYVILTIRVPYIKISEAEFYVNGTEFKFYCKPYFLRLHLPGELADDDRQKASYDIDKGTIVAHLPKLHTGEHFDNLGMITSLLSKKPAKDLKKIGTSPGIEVAKTTSGEDEGEGSGEESDEFDWQVEQEPPAAQAMEDKVAISIETAPRIFYGFANLHSGVFTKLQEDIPSIVDCPDPDHMTPHERRLGRSAHEEASFDPEHYLADLMDNSVIADLLSYEPPWRDELEKWKAKCKALLTSTGTGAAAVPSAREPEQDIVAFSSGDIDQLKELPNRDFLLDKATKRSLYLGLVDILFAFAYDQRTTLGENNVESAWTICKLSSTLSWLEVFRGSVHEVVYCCLRRSLTYPLFRHWQLALAVLQDARDIFRLGRRKVLQCLLVVRRLLNASDPYYILNNLYITEYCVWIQKSSARQIQKMADELDEVKIEPQSLGWDLVELEQAASLVIEEERQRDKENYSSASSKPDGGYTSTDVRRREEDTPATSHRLDDTVVEQLASDLKGIHLSSPCDTATKTTGSSSDCHYETPAVDDRNTELEDPSTNYRKETSAINGQEAQLEGIAKLIATNLSLTAQKKPLIEELDQRGAGTSDSGSSSSDSESSSCTSSGEESSDTDSSENDNSHSSGSDEGEHG